MRKLVVKTNLMELYELKRLLFQHIADKNNEDILHEWQKTADEIGIEKEQLEYVISEIGNKYFDECKDGFFTKNKAFIEAKYRLKDKQSIPIINVSGSGNIISNQSSFVNSDLNLSNNPPQKNPAMADHKSGFSKIISWILSNAWQLAMILIGAFIVYKLGWNK